MTLAPWRSPLARALHQNRSLVYTRYLQLATVRLDQRPANRTVVFRGFLEGTNTLKFVTDQRSEKVEQIAGLPWGEACWYFPKTREQFRLLGQLTVVGEHYSDPTLTQARELMWQDFSDNGRSQFYWPVPGQPKAEAITFNPPEIETEVSPGNFCLLLLDPERVDQLELRGTPQSRCLYQRDCNQNWSVQDVNP
ncbi:MAG: Npun_F5749 family FMN-dependent PPOX-type flavoprotein [Microcoleaceae cyanobacterium]